MCNIDTLELKVRVLVACEFSGVVRDAFTAAGHDATSCDLIPTRRPQGKHLQCDVLTLLDQGWDLMIAHPPCDHLCISGRRWFPQKRLDGRQDAALEFVRKLLAAPIPRICLENPVGVISTKIRKPTQYIHPWQFGKMENKKTGLWLVNLPLLIPTKIVPGLFNWSQNHCDSAERKKNRSIFYPTIAAAMAAQWGCL